MCFKNSFLGRCWDILQNSPPWTLEVSICFCRKQRNLDTCLLWHFSPSSLTFSSAELINVFHCFFAGIYWYGSPFTRRHNITSSTTRHFMCFMFWQRGVGTDRGGEETLGFRVSEPNVGSEPSTVNRGKDDIFFFQRWCCFLRAGWVVKKLLLFLW